MPVDRWSFRPLKRVLIAALVVGAWSAHAADESLYTVQPSGHPWNIAQRFLNNSAYAARLARLNQISHDRRIVPGSQLRIPAQ